MGRLLLQLKGLRFTITKLDEKMKDAKRSSWILLNDIKQ